MIIYVSLPQDIFCAFEGIIVFVMMFFHQVSLKLIIF